MASPASMYKHPLLLLLLLTFFSCRKDAVENDTPVISYLRYSKVLDEAKKDSVLSIVFSYRDLDGDLGYNLEADTNYPFGFGHPYFYNIHCDLFEIENGQKKYLVDGSGDTIRYSQRLRSITPEGKYKQINGEMVLHLVFTNLKILQIFPDSVQAEIRINDRALHMSNTISTPVIPLDL